MKALVLGKHGTLDELKVVNDYPCLLYTSDAADEL